MPTIEEETKAMAEAIKLASPEHLVERITYAVSRIDIAVMARQHGDVYGADWWLKSAREILLELVGIKADGHEAGTLSSVQEEAPKGRGKKH